MPIGIYKEKLMTKNNQSIKPAVVELERLFKAINKKKFNGSLPWCAIIVQSTSNKNAHGWFFANSWVRKGDRKPVHELSMCAESLNRPIEDILNTLIHEMVHLYCHVNDIGDCKNNYHNVKFKVQCNLVDLECTQIPRYGWASTKLTPKLKKELMALRPKKTAFTVFRKSEMGRQKRGSKLKKWQCPQCKTNIRVGYLPENFPGVDCRECGREYQCLEH